MVKTIGILTAGGDSPGLNAAIRAIGKSAYRTYGMQVIGFQDGFLGLMQNRFVRLSDHDLTGILTRGGTILGTSRVKIHEVDVGDGRVLDMTPAMRDIVQKHQLEALVCLGGDGTARNAIRLANAGVPVLLVPKTIDNDVRGTDSTFGFDTAMSIATEAIDRIHSTAHSHHRIMIVELMGHTAGWLALGSGIAGGADVILIPEIPYDIDAVASSISARRAMGSTFSIIAVAEGAISQQDARARAELKARKDSATGEEREELKRQIKELDATRVGGTNALATRLSEMTGLESRVTILGHVQRGGTPTAADRVLATCLGSACADFIAQGINGVMVAARGEEAVPVPLNEVAGPARVVPLDHPWIHTARNLGITLGD